MALSNDFRDLRSGRVENEKMFRFDMDDAMIKSGGGGGNRTPGRVIMIHLLYR
jgi:hypothetical protein